jgi:exodeoxyribonuclease VII large subunit
MNRTGDGPTLAAHFFRVPDLVAYIRDLLAADVTLADIWVWGELAELSQSAAGHTYFTIRDGGSKLPAVMFRSALRRQTLPLAAGYSALVHGAVGIYEQRSIFQLIADIVLPGDAGALRAHFEAMRLRLEQEGLFAAERKRPLPRLPRRIGIVTSEAGAVIHDMLNVWQRRYPALELILAPSAVQGEDAARQLVNALARLTAFHGSQPEGSGLDLIIVARGGGSPEELAAFNEERVARAIFAAPVPVVCAVGHETDYTIVDLVADLRAPTPSAAAEMVVPDRSDLQRDVARLMERGRGALIRQLALARTTLDRSRQQLERRAPARLIDEQRRRVDDLAARGTRAVQTLVALARSRVHARESQLAALSPLTTLSRGYAICTPAAGGGALMDATQVSPGDRLAVRLARGRILGEVIEREAPAEATPRREVHVER